jgi:hypothetical protein
MKRWRSTECSNDAVTASGLWHQAELGCAVNIIVGISASIFREEK